MRPLVFAGPSLHGVDLSSWPELDIAPPAGCGDILAAVRAGRRRIGLIDGVFRDAASVWHKEILHALSQGAEVLGAASMGALRAAECGVFGMRGVGLIHAAYADGTRMSDADVALVYGPSALGYPPLSLPLVDAEATLAEALARKLLPQEGCDALLAAARALHFADRSFAAMAAAARLPAEVAATLAAAAVHRKRADALLLLDALAAPPDPRPPPAFVFSDTWFFRVLSDRVGGGA